MSLFAPPSLAPALKGGDGGALFVCFLRRFLPLGLGKRTGGGKEIYNRHVIVYQYYWLLGIFLSLRFLYLKKCVSLHSRFRPVFFNQVCCGTETKAKNTP